MERNNSKLFNKIKLPYIELEKFLPLGCEKGVFVNTHRRKTVFITFDRCSIIKNSTCVQYSVDKLENTSSVLNNQ